MNTTFRATLVLIVLFVSACSEQEQLGLISITSKTNVSYVNDVKPILESRCVACHACYDAPCQLKLASYDGVTRGAAKDKVYEPTRLTEAPLSRLYFDAQSTIEWRSKGFHSVLSEHIETDRQKVKDQFSTLIGMLDLKTQNPLPIGFREVDTPIDDPSSWQCPSGQDEFNEYAADYPQRGMPYGLPPLSADESGLLRQWVSAGAPNDSNYRISKDEQEWITEWETFLNRNSLKHRLVSRYIYEHLFLASLYSDKTTPGNYFQMVRSTTPPGSQIDVVATRRPYDAPNVSRVYYRLRLNKETVVAKTHMPYRLDEHKQRDWADWFFESEYEVTFLPSYDIESASNPFKVFAQLPAVARYKFMLSEANFTVKGFIKGPVCKGPSAVNVINEHFWVFFIDPDHQGGEGMQDYLASVKPILDLPAEKEDTLNLFGAWDEFADKEKAFLIERTKFIEQNLNDKGVFDLDLIWDGEGDNPNAALTVYRHFDNASVHKGLNGQVPKTAWVIDYPLLERIHYLLVAGYDVYGNISHQLLSRVYMDFLRMEGESMFLTFLNQGEREEIRQHWYREADGRIEEFMALTDVDNQIESIVQDSDTQPKLALYQKFANRIGDALHEQYSLNSVSDAELVTAIKRLQRDASESFMFLPEVTFLQVASRNTESYFTLIRNTGHLNNTSILFEDVYIEEDETTVSVVPGFIGSRPNAFMHIPREQFSSFAERLSSMQTSEDYQEIMSNYGIRRTDPKFWQRYDQFLNGFKRFSEVNYGVLDLSKLENR